MVLVKALVGLDDDGRCLDQFNGVDRIVAAANAELEDGREVALIAVVSLVAAAGAGELAGFAIFVTAPAIRPAWSSPSALTRKERLACAKILTFVL